MILYQFNIAEKTLRIAFAVCIIVILFIVGTSVFRGLLKDKEDFKHNLFLYSVPFLITAISSISFFAVIGDIAYQINNFAIPYNNSQFETISGTVHNFNDNDSDWEYSFNVNNENFQITPQNLIDLNMTKRIDIKNGDFIVIEYVKHPKNQDIKIFKITKAKNQRDGSVIDTKHNSTK